MWLLEGVATLGAYAGIPFGLLVLAVAQYARPRLVLLACVPLALWAGAVVGSRALFAPMVPCDAQPMLRVATVNVLYTNERLAELAGQVLAQEPDLVVFAELQKELATISPALAEAYPYRLSTDIPWVTLASRYPLEAAERVMLPEATPGREPLVARVHVNGTPVSVLAVHAVVPRDATSYREHVAQYDALLRQLRAVDGAVIALGDFNATVLSPAFVRLLIAGDLRVAGDDRVAEPTHMLFEALALRIDHVLARGTQVCAEHVFDLAGSDHRGVVVDLGLPGRA